MGNVDVLRGMYEAFGRGDIETVLASFDPQIEWRQAESNPYEPEGKPWIGPDAIVENLFMKLGQEWDSFTVSPGEFYDAGEAVIVAVLRYGGRARLSGIEIDETFGVVFTIRDGKIARGREYSTRDQALQAAGLSE